MINNKKILWVVLISVMLYVALEIKETYMVVNSANDEFYKSNNPAKMLFQNGSRLDPSSQEYKDRIAQMEKRDKKRLAQIDVAKVPKELAAKAYRNFHIDIFGTIDEGMAYRIETRYIASADKKSCKTYDDGLFASHSWIPSSESFEYHPKIEGTRHQATIPLGVFNPHEKCKFKLKSVVLFISPRENQKFGRSVYLFHSDAFATNLNNYRFKAWLNRNEWTGREKNKINMECIAPAYSFSGKEYTPCGLKPLTDGYAIVENIPRSSTKYELNIGKSSLNMGELDEAFNKLGYRHKNRGSTRSFKESSNNSKCNSNTGNGVRL